MFITDEEIISIANKIGVKIDTFCLSLLQKEVNKLYNNTYLLLPILTSEYFYLGGLEEETLRANAVKIVKYKLEKDGICCVDEDYGNTTLTHVYKNKHVGQLRKQEIQLRKDIDRCIETQQKKINVENYETKIIKTYFVNKKREKNSKVHMCLSFDKKRILFRYNNNKLTFIDYIKYVLFGIFVGLIIALLIISFPITLLFILLAWVDAIL